MQLDVVTMLSWINRLHTVYHSWEDALNLYICCTLLYLLFSVVLVLFLQIPTGSGLLLQFPGVLQNCDVSMIKPTRIILATVGCSQCRGSCSKGWCSSSLKPGCISTGNNLYHRHALISWRLRLCVVFLFFFCTFWSFEKLVIVLRELWAKNGRPGCYVWNPLCD